MTEGQFISPGDLSLDENVVLELGGRILQQKFEVKRLPPERLADLTDLGGLLLTDSFKYADPVSRGIVKEYMKSDLSCQVVLLDGDIVLDGQHRVTAAILSSQTVLAITIDE
jgi:hypothetical protein